MQFLINAGFATGIAGPVLATGSTAEGGVSPVQAMPNRSPLFEGKGRGK
jgi:hypothetical protein